MRRRLLIRHLRAIPLVLALLSATCSPKYPTAPDPLIAAVQVFYGRGMGDALTGESYLFRAYAIRSDGAYIDVTSSATWFSSDSKIMSPQPNAGVFSALSAGRADVGARYQSLSGAVTITAVAKDSYPRLWAYGGEPYTVGGKDGINLSILYSEHTGQSITNAVTWASSDPSIARVDGSMVTGLQVGTAVLSTTYNGITFYYHTSVHPSR